MSREWRLYVADMKACCGRVTEYTAGLSREEFERKRLVYDATLRKNVLIHGYLGIDNDIIWDIVRNEIGKLSAALERLEAANPRSDSTGQ